MYDFVCHSRSLQIGVCEWDESLSRITEVDTNASDSFVTYNHSRVHPHSICTRGSCRLLARAFVSTHPPISLLSPLIVSLSQSASKLCPSALLLFAEWWQPLYYCTLGVLQNSAHHCWTKGQLRCYVENTPAEHTHKWFEESHSEKFIKTLYSLF